MEFNIAVFCGTHYDLTKFDYTAFNLTCVDLKDPKLRFFLKKNSYEEDDAEYSLSSFDEIVNKHGDYDIHYAFYRADLKNGATESQLYNCYQAILIAFPSSLFISHIFSFDIYKEKLMPPAIAEYHILKMSYWDDKLIGFDNNRDTVGVFFKLYEANKNKHSYIKTAINFYTTSFQSSFNHQQFVSLVTALETIIDGNIELSYRLRRNVAILCKDVMVGKNGAINIFKNVKKLYELRSQIVHSGFDNDQKIGENLPYLRKLVSVFIVMLLNVNMEVKELNDLLTEIGYNDEIYMVDQLVMPNILNFVDINTTKI